MTDARPGAIPSREEEEQELARVDELSPRTPRSGSYRIHQRGDSMVKFTASGNGRTVIGLGLEAANIVRMCAGDPVRVRLSDLGFTGVMGTVDIMIFTATDVPAMRAMLAPMIGPETVVHEEDR